jgi:hypothetical protein
VKAWLSRETLLLSGSGYVETKFCLAPLQAKAALIDGGGWGTHLVLCAGTPSIWEIMWEAKGVLRDTDDDNEDHAALCSMAQVA